MELHEAIRHAYQGRRTQKELAALIDVDQTAVSRWARGATRPQLEEIAAIEQACDRPRGFVLRLAGFVEDAVGVPGAVAVDPELSDEGRRIVLTTYRTVLAELGNR